MSLGFTRSRVVGFNYYLIDYQPNPTTTITELTTIFPIAIATIERVAYFSIGQVGVGSQTSQPCKQGNQVSRISS